MAHNADQLTSYWQRTQWPLQSLYFLLPMLVLYDAGALAYAPAHDYRLPPIWAESLLDKFFHLFGVSGYYVPGLVLIVVLICLHAVRRDPWRPELRLYPFMLFEAVALSVPLFTFMLVLFRQPGSAVQAANHVAGHPTALAHFPHWFAAATEPRSNGSGGLIPSWQAGIVFSLGAGIYEEFLFRLIAIALIHMLLVDVLALPRRWGAIGAVVISAVAFALYHFASQSFVWGKFFFYTVAGVYFAVIYLLRGFGIVAATHAMYDVMWVAMTYAVH